jgi:hypothetical protein
LENTGLFCTASTILENTLKKKMVEAINVAVSGKNPFLAILKKNIETVLSADLDESTADIDRGAAELWGVDLSHRQLENAEAYLRENGYTAKLICSPFTMPVDGSEVILCNRKISTYINALAKAGLVFEQMIEQNDRQTMESNDDNSDKTKKAKMIPISVCFKARKL